MKSNYSSIGSRVKGIFLIIRPYNSFLAGISIIIGVFASLNNLEVLFSQKTLLLNVILGYLSTFFIAAAGYVINDVYDIEIDRLNQPHRPLPSGLLSILQARMLAIFLFLLGIGCGFFINSEIGIVSLVTSVLLYLYAKEYKKSGLVGNMLVSLLTALPFIVGGLLVSSELIYYLIPSIFAFLLILGREIIKDIEDVPGDQLENVKSLAILVNPRFARNIASAILLVLVLLSFLPLVLRVYSNILWYGLMVVLVDSFILVAIINLYRNVKDEDSIIHNSTFSKRILKTSIVIGIFGFVLMPFVPIRISF